MRVLILVLVALTFVVAQVLIGGTRMVFALPGLELLAFAAVLAVWPKLKTARGASVAAVVSALLFVAYVVVRNRLSLVESIGRMQLVIAIGSFLVYGLIALILYRPEDRRRLVWVWLALAVAQTVIGAIQFKEGNQWMPISWLQRGDDWWRASGQFISPNHFAGFLELTALMAASFVIWGRVGWITKVLCAYVSLCCLAGIAISGSRGGYISIAAGVFALFLLSLLVFGRLRPERLLPVGIGGLVVVIVAFAAVTTLMTKSDFVKERMENVADKENMRFLLWNSAIKQYSISPVVGTGAFSFIYYGRAFRDPQVQNDPIHVHNDYLQLLADYGLVGAGLFLLLYATHLFTGCAGLMRIVGRAYQDGVSQGNGIALCVGALSGLAAMTVHSAVDFNMQITNNALQMAVLFGILAAPYSPENLPIGRFRKYSLVTFRFLLPVIGLGFIIYTAKWVPAEYFSEKARVALRDKFYNESIDFATRGLAWDDKNPDLYYYAAESNRVLGVENKASRDARFAESLELYKKAVQLFPMDSSILIRIANAYSTAGLYDKAMEYLDYAATFDPNSALVSANRGLVELRAGNVSDAHDYFMESMKMDNRPVNTLGYWGLAETNKLLGAGVESFIPTWNDRVQPASSVNEPKSQ